jgi:hypothetical protein
VRSDADDGPAGGAVEGAVEPGAGAGVDGGAAPGTGASASAGLDTDIVTIKPTTPQMRALSRVHRRRRPAERERGAELTA